MMVISNFISCQKSSSSSSASATGSGTALPPHRDARGPAARGKAPARSVGRSLCRPRLGLPVAWNPLREADSAGPSRVECRIGARAGEPSGAAGMSSERPCRPAYCLVGGRAQVAKLVDAAGLGPAAARCGGSIPFLGTTKQSKVVHSSPESPPKCGFFVAFCPLRGNMVPKHPARNCGNSRGKSSCWWGNFWGNSSWPRGNSKG